MGVQKLPPVTLPHFRKICTGLAELGPHLEGEPLHRSPALRDGAWRGLARWRWRLVLLRQEQRQRRDARSELGLPLLEPCEATKNVLVLVAGHCFGFIARNWSSFASSRSNNPSIFFTSSRMPSTASFGANF